MQYRGFLPASPLLSPSPYVRVDTTDYLYH